VVLLPVLVLSFSCKENLPPYQDPAQVFEGFVRAEYLYSLTSNTIAIQLVVQNVYDETFEGRAILEGTVELTLARKPDVKRIFFLSDANLIQGRYQPNSRTLTIDPKDSVRLRVFWNFDDDRGRNLRQDEFRYNPDPSCPGRRIAAQETIVIRGSVKVFERTEEVKLGPVSFSFCHINAYFVGCPSVSSTACRPQ
jgi:hypothetical protein